MPSRSFNLLPGALSATLVLAIAACSSQGTRHDATSDQTYWAAQMVAAITQQWVRPPGSDPNLKAWVHYHLDSQGTASSVEIIRSSGMQAFDQSIMQAILKASPLPMPRIQAAFVSEINVCFSPNPRNCQ